MNPTTTADLFGLLQSDLVVALGSFLIWLGVSSLVAALLRWLRRRGFDSRSIAKLVVAAAVIGFFSGALIFAGYVQITDGWADDPVYINHLGFLLSGAAVGVAWAAFAVHKNWLPSARIQSSPPEE